MSLEYMNNEELEELRQEAGEDEDWRTVDEVDKLLFLRYQGIAKQRERFDGELTR